MEDKIMKKYTVAIFITIEAENEKEAQRTAIELEQAMLDSETNIDGVFWDSINSEVEEEKE